MEIKMTPAAFGEPSTIIGSCLNCTTPANLLATLAVIVIGMALAVHFEPPKRPGYSNSTAEYHRSCSWCRLYFQAIHSTEYFRSAGSALQGLKSFGANATMLSPHLNDACLLS